MKEYIALVENELDYKYLGDRVKLLVRAYPASFPLVLPNDFKRLTHKLDIDIKRGDSHFTWLIKYEQDTYTSINFVYHAGIDNWDRFIEKLNEFDKKRLITPKAKKEYKEKTSQEITKQIKEQSFKNNIYCNLLKIKDVKWGIQKKTGYPCTVVFWEDGIKTSVVCNTTFDKFSVETGIMACYMKRLFGNNGSYNNVLHKWEKKYYDEGHYDVLGLNFNGKKATTPVAQDFCLDKKED